MPTLKIATVKDLKTVPTVENGEKLVSLKLVAPAVMAKYIKLDMVPLYGEDIIVRETVAKKLATAQGELSLINHHWQFLVVYGYRSPAVQQKYYAERQKELLSREVPAERLEEETHKLVAVPEVAGHPTGGAIDITIIDQKDGIEIDMGGHIADFSNLERIPTHSPSISSGQLKNRLLLHDLLTKVGFAPFYGEWWHYSYGDKEWAFFYDKLNAIYNQIEYEKETS